MSTSTFSFPQMGEVYDTLIEKGVTGDLLQNQLLGEGRLADLAEAAVCGTIPHREAVRQALKLGLILPDPIILVIDYGTKQKPRTLEEMIAAGHYDWKNDDITAKRFPIVGVGSVELEAKLFHPNRDISSDDAERLIKADDKENPWEPAKIEHLLSFGEKFPDEQRKYPIVALDSVAEVGGNRRVSCLDWRDHGWRAYCRFLVVRKVSVPRT